MANLYLSQDSFDNAKNIITQFLIDAGYDGSVENGTGMYDIVIQPSALIYGLLKQEVDKTRGYLSLTDAATLYEDETLSDDEYTAAVDSILSNWFVTRNSGIASSGSIRLWFGSVPSLLSFDSGELIGTINSVAFVTASELAYLSTDFSAFINTTTNNTEYYIDIPVISSESSSTAVKQGDTVTLSYINVLLLRAEAASDFTSGTDPEDSDTFISRTKEAINTRELITTRAIKTVLLDSFPQIWRLFIAGHGANEMMRDVKLVSGVYVHVGNMADIWVASELVNFTEENCPVDANGYVTLKTTPVHILKITEDFKEALNNDSISYDIPLSTVTFSVDSDTWLAPVSHTSTFLKLSVPTGTTQYFEPTYSYPDEQSIITNTSLETATYTHTTANITTQTANQKTSTYSIGEEYSDDDGNTIEYTCYRATGGQLFLNKTISNSAEETVETTYPVTLDTDTGTYSYSGTSDGTTTTFNVSSGSSEFYTIVVKTVVKQSELIYVSQRFIIDASGKLTQTSGNEVTTLILNKNADGTIASIYEKIVRTYVNTTVKALPLIETYKTTEQKDYTMSPGSTSGTFVYTYNAADDSTSITYSASYNSLTDSYTITKTTTTTSGTTTWSFPESSSRSINKVFTAYDVTLALTESSKGVLTKITETVVTSYCNTSLVSGSYTLTKDSSSTNKYKYSSTDSNSVVTTVEVVYDSTNKTYTATKKVGSTTYTFQNIDADLEETLILSGKAICICLNVDSTGVPTSMDEITYTIDNNTTFANILSSYNISPEIEVTSSLPAAKAATTDVVVDAETLVTTNSNNIEVAISYSTVEFTEAISYTTTTTSQDYSRTVTVYGLTSPIAKSVSEFYDNTTNKVAAFDPIVKMMTPVVMYMDIGITLQEDYALADVSADIKEAVVTFINSISKSGEPFIESKLVNYLHNSVEGVLAIKTPITCHGTFFDMANSNYFNWVNATVDSDDSTNVVLTSEANVFDVSNVVLPVGSSAISKQITNNTVQFYTTEDNITVEECE